MNRNTDTKENPWNLLPVVFIFTGQGQNIYKLWKDGQSMEFDKAKFMEKLKELVAYGMKK